MNALLKACLSVYRRLARAYPHEFQMVYGEELELTGEDALPDIWKRQGYWGVLRFLTDVAMRLPVEYFAELRQDAAFAGRALRKSPTFTLAAIVSLGIGLGLCNAFFTQVDALLFRPLPGISKPDGLVAIQDAVSYPYFERIRGRQDIAGSASALLGPVSFNISLDGASQNGPRQRIYGQLVSPEYFQTLHAEPTLGRFFDSQTDRAGQTPAVVLSERFWRTRMNGDAHIIGRTLHVNGVLTEIVGVGPKDFMGVWPLTPSDLFMPVTTGVRVAPEIAGGVLDNSRALSFHVVMRLTDGVSVASAQAALNTIKRTMDAEESPTIKTNDGRQVSLISANGVIPLSSEQRASSLGIAFILSSLVLALVSANLAGLLVARGSDRRKEIAVRVAIGASRFRLLRQLLTESTLLALAGGVAGVLCGQAILASFTALANAADSGITPPQQIDYSLNLTVLAFTTAVAAVAGVGFGFLPAIAATRGNTADALKASSGSNTRVYRTLGLRNLLVASQVGLSLTVVLITGFIVLGYQRLGTIDPGFDTHDLLLFQLDPLHDGYSWNQSVALLEKIPDRLSRLSPVRQVTVSVFSPLADYVAAPNTTVAARRSESDSEITSAVVQLGIGPKYFETLGVPMAAGREFDVQVAPESVILNQTAALDLFGSTDAVGRTLRDASGRRLEVIGVARDSRSAFFNAKPAPTLYERLPLSPIGASVIVRGAPGPQTLAAIREDLARLDPNLVLLNPRTMDRQLAQMSTLLSGASAFYGGLGIFGLILASVGLAGVTACAVVRRRKELGIRMALGARRGQVVRLVMREGAVLILAGGVLGLLGEVAASRMLSATFSEIARLTDSAQSNIALAAGAPLLLVAITMSACYIPARRSARIDPSKVLREE